MSENEKKPRPQDKWDAKAGLVSKTFKLDKKTVEEYQAACKKAGVAMGPQLAKLMRAFIEETNKE